MVESEPMRGRVGRLRNVLGDRRGAISVLAAFFLVGAIGISASALESGHGLLQRVENQRVADLAACGGALVYNSTSSTSSATSAVDNIVALNGLSGDGTASVVSSPTGDGNQAVELTVTSNAPPLLTRVLTSNTTRAVSATAYAEITGGNGCGLALDRGNVGDVSDSGGATLNLNSCVSR
jgi:uncharacterized membrane protein